MILMCSISSELRGGERGGDKRYEGGLISEDDFEEREDGEERGNGKRTSDKKAKKEKSIKIKNKNGR